MKASSSNFFSSMTDPEEEINHEKWYYRKFAGAEFRAKYYTFGNAYCNMEIQKRNYIKVKKWILFGPEVNIIPHWKGILGPSKVCSLTSVIRSRNSYTKKQFEWDFMACANYYKKTFFPDVEIESPEDEEEELEFLASNSIMDKFLGFLMS